MNFIIKTLYKYCQIKTFLPHNVQFSVVLDYDMFQQIYWFKCIHHQVLGAVKILRYSISVVVFGKKLYLVDTLAG